jgi:hypothetical protein
LQLPRHLYLRLQISRNIFNSKNYNINDGEFNLLLLQWLRRLEFKMGVIEAQSSNTTLFYSI